jgi:ABC-2 type transport system permease protein
MAQPRRPQPIVELTLARFREFMREPGAVFWAFGFPLLLALALGIAFREQDPALPRVAVEPDLPAWAAAAAEQSESAFEAVPLERPEAERALRIGSVDLILRAAPGEERELTYHFDAERPAARAARLAVDDALQRALGRADAVVTAERVETLPGGRYIDFLFPGVIGMTLMNSCIWGIGYSIVLARKRRQLKRLAATPMRRSHYVLSTFLSRVVFLVVEVAVLLLFAWLVFDVVVRGAPAAFVLVSLAGSAAFAALALLVAARVESIEAASGWLNFVTLPMWMVSGVFFSYERFPEFAHPWIQVLPLTALNDALRAVINEGAGTVAVSFELAVLALWSVVGFTIAAARFRWQ